jgi:nucleoside-diphosphate-sugar epimerase
MFDVAESYHEKHVFVTGAAGFVGQHLVARLRELGAHSTCMLSPHDVPPPSWAETRAGEPPSVVVGDITNPMSLVQLLEAHRPRRIFHLAALTGSTRDMADLPRYLRVNTEGTASLMAACARLGAGALDSIVTMGSCEEYGPDAPAPFVELLPLRPRHPYAISKAAATLVCQAAWRSHELPVCVLRPTLLYGPGQPSRVFLAHLVAATSQGAAFDMTAGEQTKDYVHVDDAVEAILLAALAPALRGEVANLSAETEMTLQEVVHLWEKVSGVSGIARLGALPYRAHEAPRYVASSARLRAATGWAPRIPFEEGLRRLSAATAGSA